VFGYIINIIITILAKTTRNRSTKYYYLNERGTLELHAGDEAIYCNKFSNNMFAILTYRRGSLVVNDPCLIILTQFYYNIIIYTTTVLRNLYNVNLH